MCLSPGRSGTRPIPVRWNSRFVKAGILLLRRLRLGARIGIVAEEEGGGRGGIARLGNRAKLVLMRPDGDLSRQERPDQRPCRDSRTASDQGRGPARLAG